MSFILQNFEMNFFRKLRMVRIKPTFKQNSSSAGFLTLDNMNRHIIEMEYAVRGPIVYRAIALEKEIAAGVKKPFRRVVKANLGDCHAMGQPPITFFRQVLALLSYPQLMEDKRFPPDVVERAKKLLTGCRGGSVGSYTDSFGIELIRERVAESITRRDKYASKKDDIILSAGASDSIRQVMKLINQETEGKPPGVMVPIPQYPLYSAILAETGMTFIAYYLNEANNWSLEMDELNKSIKEAQATCTPRAIVIINPGNPTGQVLTKKNIEDIIKFAYRNKLILLADEVYQDNVYAEGSEFFSFKKIINDLGPPYKDMELASFMSCSKGYVGECGIRAGYCELTNFDPDVRANFAKAITATLCPSVLGQCLMDCVTNPPVKGDPSYELFEKEKNTILADLKEKAQLVHTYFNKIEGITCNLVQGAMYTFPRIEIPPKAMELAKKKNMQPDALYAFELIENTGICVVPGSGFQQMPGTYHFRSTILPPKDLLKEVLQLFEKFQKDFMKRYS